MSFCALLCPKKDKMFLKCPRVSVCILIGILGNRWVERGEFGIVWLKGEINFQKGINDFGLVN